MIFSVILPVTTIIYLYLFLRARSRLKERRSSGTRRVMSVMGSGGHTAEMLRITQKIDRLRYTPTLYVVGEDDNITERKVTATERGRSFAIRRVPRARHVGQTYFSSVFTTAYSTLMGLRVVVAFAPDLVLCNGPGTCVPLCVVAALMNLLRLLDCRIVFVESMCRTKTLSLSGKILLRVADLCVVQWEDLTDTNPGTRYFGRLT